MSRAFTAVLLSLLLASCTSGPTAVRPEDDRVVEPGTSVEASLGGNRDRRAHPIAGVQGQHIAITVQATGDGLDPYLRIYDPDGELVAEDDDSAGALGSRVLLPVTRNGRYLAEVASYNASSQGGYELSVALDRLAGEGEALVDTTGEVMDGGAERSRFAFQGGVGGQVTIAVNTDSADFDPVVELFGPDGSSLARDDDGGQERNSLLRTTLRASGTHIAVVTGFGGRMGPFRIRITLRPPAKATLQPASTGASGLATE